MALLLEIESPTPEDIALITKRLTLQLRRNEEARQRHWHSKRLRAPSKRHAKTPWD
jgi:hypothetical protein